ncbi:MAG: hypothetical protein GY780_05330 [bacterium]|nr:hypothetical protein [bacterium]
MDRPELPESEIFAFIRQRVTMIITRNNAFSNLIRLHDDRLGTHGSFGLEFQSLPADYLAEISRQIAFVSAFLGGFAATFLATLLMVKSEKRIAGWVLGCVAFSASAFIVSVVAAVTLIVVSHPSVPRNVSAGASTAPARVVCILSFVLGIYSLLASVGISGWLRSRNVGLATSISGGLGLILVTWAITGFG